MKRLSLIFVALSLSCSAFSQTLQDQKAPPELLFQLGNTSNVYFGSITQSKVGTGLLLDTTSNTTALYLQTCNYAFLTSQYKLNGVSIPKVNSDTLFPMQLNGNGSLSFSCSVLKCTGTDTITVTPVQSFSGNPGTWYTVPGLSAVVLTPTSLTVPVAAEWTINSSGLPVIKSSFHYALKFVGNATSTMSVQGWIRDYTK